MFCVGSGQARNMSERREESEDGTTESQHGEGRLRDTETGETLRPRPLRNPGPRDREPRVRGPGLDRWRVDPDSSDRERDEIINHNLCGYPIFM